MKTWFISDLHLDPSRPEILTLFNDFLDNIRPKAEALYILGDLFEYWVGDDVIGTVYAQHLETSFEKLKRYADEQIPVFFIVGNRDFLIKQYFADHTGMTLLPDTQVIDLYDTPTLIMHGDTLCTDDLSYMEFRQKARSEQWQAPLLSLNIEDRIKKALSLREDSKRESAEKSEYITDVNQQAVETAMRQHQVTQMVHGHTHRMATHEFKLDGKPAKRIVLGDWYNDVHYLAVDSKSYKLL